jgi:hypothetical protein
MNSAFPGDMQTSKHQQICQKSKVEHLSVRAMFDIAAKPKCEAAEKHVFKKVTDYSYFDVKEMSLYLAAAARVMSIKLKESSYLIPVIESQFLSTIISNVEEEPPS